MKAAAGRADARGGAHIGEGLRGGRKGGQLEGSGKGRVVQRALPAAVKTLDVAVKATGNQWRTHLSDVRRRSVLSCE